MKRVLSFAAVAALFVVAPCRGAVVDAPESVSAFGVPPITVAPLPGLPLAAPAASFVAPSFAAAPSVAVPAAASPAAATARAQIERAAAPPKPGVDAGARLGRVFDASANVPAAAPSVSAAAVSERAPRTSGLKRAAASVRVRHEFKSPEGAEARELQRLAVSLEENGLPSYRTAVVKDAVDERRPTVVLLAPASRHKVAIAREGGRQAPGDVHLALDVSWLIRETGPDGRGRLLLKKGVTFDAHGQATIVEYAVPRVVRYFANYLTLGANDRDDGVPFEQDLDVPQSNSLGLEAVVNDKLRMSLLGAANGIEVPKMLGIPALPEGADKAAEIRRRVDEFLDGYEGDEVVVKPSGPQFHSGRGVKFFRKDQRAEIAAHALELANSPLMTRDGAVLVSERVRSAPLERDGRKMETTLRVLAARAPWGGAVTTDIYARVGPWGKPTTGEAADPRDNAVFEPWEGLLKDWKLTTEQAEKLDRRTRAMGVEMLEAVMKLEQGLKRAPGEPYRAQTDMIGLDVMIEKRGGELVPVMIEVNDHDSGGQFNLDRTIAPERSGAHSREWVATMLQRARRDALRGKRIVVVGAGYEGKRFVFERAKELGVHIILIDRPDTWAKDLVSELIPADNSKPAEALAAVRAKLLASARKNGKIDGVTTFWENDVELTADVAQALDLPYHTKAAASAARSKFETQQILELSGVPAARREVVPNISEASDAGERAAMLEKFRDAASRVGFPAVLKPVSGAEAMGTERVNSLDEAEKAYERVSGVVNEKTDSIFAGSRELLLMQYLDGREYDVDLVLRGGEVLFESITDNKPTEEPSFLAMGSRLPSTLSASEQRAAIEQAVSSARALGLTDGVIHMEGKVTSEGPRLLEANARMGGSYVRDWVRDAWGVDLVEEGLMAAAGIGGKPFKPSRPLTHLDGDFINADKPGVIRALELPEAARKLPGFVRFREVMHPGQTISTEQNGGYARVAMLEVGGATAEEAARNLAAIKAKIVFEVDPVQP